MENPRIPGRIPRRPVRKSQESQDCEVELKETKGGYKVRISKNCRSEQMDMIGMVEKKKKKIEVH